LVDTERRTWNQNKSLVYEIRVILVDQQCLQVYTLYLHNH